ncbi:NAD(P)/FAD-dependent oxidoreductase [Paracoccus seriniphilus]|uniref:NAD(P)/FAD-dependent oxidoreductase n=1 Tax=Paracoccus seriniphilus TaxID=184748 RepID=UPI003566B435
MYDGSHPKDQALWSVTAPAAVQTDVLDGDCSFDVVIVGGGLTGLRAAITLAEAGSSVAVMDSRHIGYGASGRSGGQCNPIWRATPEELAAKYGQAQAERLVRTTLSCADDLFDDIRRFGIDCGAEQNGWYQAAHTRKAAAGLRRLGAAWQKAGAPIDVVKAPDLHERIGSKAYDFALRHEKGGFVQPLALTRGFAHRAKSLGVRLFENAPARQMERHAGLWRVSTDRGTLSAEKVVLATNGYTDALWPGLRRSILPMVSIAVATSPLSPELQASVLPGRVTFADTRLAIYFGRYDADNRLIFGCVGSNESVGSFGGHRRLRSGLLTVFPQLAGTSLDYTWMGRIAVTPDLMPHLHEPAPGVLAGLGYSGRGIAMTSVMGRCLAQRALGAKVDDLPFPVSPIETLSFHGVARNFIPLMAPAMSMLDRATVFQDRVMRRFS